MGLIINIIIGVAIIIILASGIRIVRPVELGVVERLGKYKRIAQQGFHWIIPIIDQMRFVNVTERMVDVEPQKIITKDDLNAAVDAVVYFKVKDVKKALYNADDYGDQIVTLAKTTLRDVIGSMTLSEANAKREQLNTKLEKELDRQTDAWGIDIIRVELQRIQPPDEVQDAMNKVVIAERDKKAAIDFATAVETKADGEKRADIKRAEGKRQKNILIAQGQAEAIKLVNLSGQRYFKGQAVALKQLEVVSESLRRNSKIVVPSDGKLINIVGDLAGQNIIPVEETDPKE